MISAISLASSFVICWNTIISSNLLRSSGLKYCFNSFVTKLFIKSDYCLSSDPEQNAASAFASSYFPTPVGSEKDETGNGLIGILESNTSSTDSTANGFDRLVLSNNPFL
ncbi:hypothetical protein CDL15_Pgr020029 [Punica granatum]|uniref:Uncharacterized protein n=1 Tax=Punica granatum TaxID=22663 RepID=A0A218VQF9_PUNGR|nr:hypothetical protein CDL15_Pgr020029 [Punica granatum]